MPEMTVTVRWPDGSVVRHYSPSLVMHDHMESGSSYRVDDFAKRASIALHEASERVRAKYGFGCASSSVSLDQIELTAARFAESDLVEVIDMHPALPPTTEEHS